VIGDIDTFILDNTRVLAPPHVPELSFHLADDAVALWEMTEEELGRIGLPPPFWAFAWAGGQALARYVLDTPALVAGRKVWDVAAGSGLVAIAAKRAGASTVVAIDIDPFAAAACRLNARLNAVEIEIQARDPIGRPIDADLLLIGDLFYDRDLAARLMTWIEDAAASGVDVLIGDPGRTYLPTHRLEKIASYAVATLRTLEDAEVKQTAVWRLRAQTSSAESLK
jgi:predicted nicotinamide N-methyase